jgi:riboflavin biosynthesis pyrimidine reductase
LADTGHPATAAVTTPVPTSIPITGCSGTGDSSNSSDVFPILQRPLEDLSSHMARFRSKQQQEEQNYDNDPSVRPRRRRRPFVTLAYAQSLDGKIAVKRTTNHNTNAAAGTTTTTTTTTTSSNFAISSDESLYLTHALRSMHDGVLIGGRTLTIDNPRLTNRLWTTDQRPPPPPSQQPPPQQQQQPQQPRPIVLDTNLRAIRTMGATCRAQNLIVCCSHRAFEEYCNGNNDAGSSSSSSVTIPDSVTLLPCKTVQRAGTNHIDDDDEDGRDGDDDGNDGGLLDLQDVLERLYEDCRIGSVMVEGGSSVLTAFLRHHEPFVDHVCVTISPILLGERNGLSSVTSLRDTSRAEATTTETATTTTTTPEALRIGPIAHSVIVGGDCIIFCYPRC